MLCLYSLWKFLSLSNSTCNIAFFFSYVANLFFKLFTFKFKFPIFKLIITIVWNNYIALFAYITSITTSSTNFGVLVCVIGFLDPSTKDPSSCTNLLPNSKSNECSFVNYSLLTSTYNSNGLNIVTRVCVPIFSICNLVGYIFACVYYYCCCWCCKCYYKCWKCCGLSWLSIQSS
jgi:hypothetical protein